MIVKNCSWIDILTTNDAEALWHKLFRLIARHSSTRQLYSHDELAGTHRHEIYSDLTQDIFLRLFEKNRWQYYLDNKYTNEHIEHELNRLEVPNYIAVLQRGRNPESYRLARRISDLIKTRREFRRHSLSNNQDIDGANAEVHRSQKMVLQVYGLSNWPVNKSVRDEGDLLKRIEDVPYRFRDVRRMGRGDGAQIIISNEELTQLIVDIFTALDTPLAIRRMRSLVLSKLAIEDFRPLSLDEGPPSVCEEGESFARRELPDERPTPLDLLLAKEATKNIEQVVEGLLQNLRNAVHNKPRRFAKLVAVASSCYFDPASPSQSAIARQMNISNSLVSHYRLIFDSCVHALNLTVDEYILLNEMLGQRLSRLKAESSHLARRQPRVKRQRALSLPAMVEAVRPLAMTAASCNR